MRNYREFRLSDELFMHLMSSVFPGGASPKLVSVKRDTYRGIVSVLADDDSFEPLEEGMVPVAEHMWAECGA